MELEKSFGDIVKILREEQNLPLREVAEALGVDTSMLGKIEKNSRKPTRQLIQKFASYFGVSSKDLTIAFLSDKVAYQIMVEDAFSSEVLKVAEQKVEYLKTKKTSDE